MRSTELECPSQRSNSPASNVVDYLLGGGDVSGIAIETLTRSYLYGELNAAVREVGDVLARNGALKGDRVILIGENSFFWIASYLGILRSGLICVPLPATMSREELEYVIHTTAPRFGFLQASIAARHTTLLTGICVTTDALAFDLCAPAPYAPDPFAEAGGSDLASIMFTSGSTGRPRGVMISHTNIIANTDSIVTCLNLTQADRIMTVLPLHYCFGTSLLHTHLRTGGCLVLDSRFMYPENVLQRMQATGCTGFAGVPSHFQVLLRKSTLAKKHFPHLRYVQQAGGHLAPIFVRELREALPHVRIFLMYGQTEATARLSYLPPECLDSKAGSIGKGIPGVQLRVLSETGTEVRPGEVGEIVAKGENVAGGYWNDPDETALTFRDGRLFTGDLARVDQDGFIFVVDRARDFLKCSGKRTSCRQIEEKILGFDELLEVAVIGVPDEVLGEAVRAFVVPCKKDIADLEERVRSFCQHNLPPHLVPKEIVALNQLPKNSSGKVMKQRLKAT